MYTQRDTLFMTAQCFSYRWLNFFHSFHSCVFYIYNGSLFVDFCCYLRPDLQRLEILLRVTYFL